MSQNPQMTVQDAATTLQTVIQERASMNGRELDAARNALGFLVNNFVLLDRVASALKDAAERAGVDTAAIITAIQQGQAPQPAAPAAPAPQTRAEKRRALKTAPKSEAESKAVPEAIAQE